MGSLGFILAVVGLGHLLAFAQTARHLTVNAISAWLALLQIPMLISCLWRISIDMGWWTIVIFLLASIMVGMINGVFSRKPGGVAMVYSMQPYMGIIAAAASVALWLA